MTTEQIVEQYLPNFCWQTRAEIAGMLCCINAAVPIEVLHEVLVTLTERGLILRRARIHRTAGQAMGIDDMFEYRRAS